MPLDTDRIFAKYYPKNNFAINWVPNNEVQVNNITTTYDHRGRPEIQGGGSSTKTVSYTVTIRYTGDVNIGDRLIIQEDISNYWNSAEVRGIAESETNDALAAMPQESYCTKLVNHIKKEVTAKNALICLVCCPCAVLSCLFTPCLGVEEKDRLQRADIFNARLDENALNYMATKIAVLLKRADLSVTSRIGSLRESQSQTGGNIVLTPEQFQMLVQKGSSSTGQSEVSVPGMLAQYQQHQGKSGVPSHITQVVPVIRHVMQ